MGEAVASAENQVFAISATVWDIVIERASGRSIFPIDRFGDLALRMGFEVLPILRAHAAVAGALRRHHGDPFDRMSIAQAMVEDLILMSVDAAVGRYDVRVFSAETR